MNNQHIYKRKIRQLKFLSKQLKKDMSKREEIVSDLFEKRISKGKRLLQELKQVFSILQLKKVLGSACLLFGLSYSSQSSAQTFLPAVKNPFNLVSVDTLPAPSFTDLDNDGDLDLLVGENAGNLQYFRNVGTAVVPSFTTPVMNPFGLTGVTGVAFPSFVDLDNDGDKDVLVGDGGGNMQYFQNKGTAAVANFTTAVQNPFGLTSVNYIAMPTFVDIDNDGDKDLFVGEYGGNLQYFQNTGTAALPVFGAKVQNPFGLVPTNYLAAPGFADLDNDGDKDLVIGEYGGNLQYFQNTGTAALPAFAAPAANPFGLTATVQYAIPAFADLDNDGDQDLLVGEYPGSMEYFQQVTITSVKNVEFSNPYLLKVFPNPSSDFIQISCAWFSDIEKIEIIDVTGRICSSHSNSSKIISIKDLAEGFYTVKITNKKGDIEIRKIQKT